MTAWLAEVAQSSLDIVLIVDAAEQLPPPSRDALVYLMHNAPLNLRTFVAARTDCALAVEDLVSYGQCVVIGVGSLRFQFEETHQLARGRLGANIDVDTAARLHEITEGWPLGLQLALASVASGFPRGALEEMTARTGELHDILVNVLMSHLAPADADFLVRISLVDSIHPDLCRALTLTDEAAGRLARLARETPIFSAAEGSDWLRMHSLAREILRERADQLDGAELAALHARAARWLAEHGLLEAAAIHALASGEREAAYDLAEQCLYDALLRRGHLTAVLDWIAQLPAKELNKRPRLLLAVAWALSVSARHQEAEPLVARILEHAGDDGALRCECALIVSGGATYADDPDRFAALNDPWADSPPLTDPVLRFIHANRQAYRAFLAGDPARARVFPVVGDGEYADAFGYVTRWRQYIIGLSHLWEGHVILAESVLRPALERAEADLGRRSTLTCMLAALLATAVWAQDRPDAAMLLANRLDMLERSGQPEAVFFGYRTIARIAAAEGHEHRALELLEGMYAAGVARKWPRLCIASLTEQVRLHGWVRRSETCRWLCERIDALVAAEAPSRGPLWLRTAHLLQHLAHAHCAIAGEDWKRALGALEQAGRAAAVVSLGGTRIEIMALRAFVLHRSGEPSLALLREAIGLANTYGLVRLFEDAHPALADWARQADNAQRGAAGEASAAKSPYRFVQPPARRDAHRLRATPSMALTPKEREVLDLLAQNLSNKEIARAMQVGEETIKWHLKNLFGKLDAGTRKHAVRRAHLLGLLEPAI